MDKVIAKFYVSEIAQVANQGNTYPQRRIVLQAASADGKMGENDAFAKASPSGKLEISIVNLPAAEFFNPGEAVYLTFTKENPVVVPSI